MHRIIINNSHELNCHTPESTHKMQKMSNVPNQSGQKQRVRTFITKWSLSIVGTPIKNELLYEIH